MGQASSPHFCLKVGNDGIVFAVDSDPVVLSHLKANLERLAPSTKTNVRIFNSDASDTTIPDSSVDCALFANVLHDIVDKGHFFAEITRILRKPFGAVVDIDWNKREMDNGPPKEIRLTENQSRKLLNDAGFRVVRLINAGPYHYGLVSKLSTR